MDAPKTGSPVREWIEDTKRFDTRAHEKLVALLGNHFAAGDRLSAKLMHLIWIGVDLLVTHLYSDGVKIHIRGALGHGATPEEIVEVLEIATTAADRSIDIAFPIIFEEAEAAGVPVPDRGRRLTAEEERLKIALTGKLGFLPRWFELAVRAAPEFVRAYLDMGHAPFKQGALDRKSRALVYLGLYSSPALIEAHEIRSHVREALARGATTQEMLDVVQLVSGIGLHAISTGMPKLAVEIVR